VIYVVDSVTTIGAEDIIENLINHHGVSNSDLLVSKSQSIHLLTLHVECLMFVKTAITKLVLATINDIKSIIYKLSIYNFIFATI